MKKTKILSLLCLFLLAAILLVGCGEESTTLQKASSFTTVLNPNYNTNPGIKVAATVVNGLDDYSLVESNEYFAVFSRNSYDDDETMTKVVSLRTGEVILSLASSENTVYSVSLSSSTPTFVTYKRYGADLDKKRYTLYDAAGNTVVTHSYAVSEPSAFADMILYGSTLYKEDNNGNLTEVTTIAENVKISTPSAYSEKYFYFFNQSSILVYDRQFNLQTIWNAPIGIKNSLSAFVLNNSNVLIQYSIQLDPETTTYDFIQEYNNEFSKFNLYTYILNVETGKTSALETSYVFSSVESAYHITTEEDPSNRMFTENFENIALVYPITNMRIDTTTASCDLVLLDNSGKATASLKITDYQYPSLPQKITNDTYKVSTQYGTAIVNSQGTVLTGINNSSLSIIGSYIVSEKAIYNPNMEVVYNLSQNNARVIGTMDGTIFISEEVNDFTYEILSIRDGVINSICSASYDDTTDLFGYDSDAGYYWVYRQNTEKYSYFNANGDLLIASDYRLSTVVTSETNGTAILKNAENEYYMLSK